MKINKIFLVGILLLAIITLGAASAAEDAGDLAVADEDDSIIESSQDVEIASDDGEEVLSDGNVDVTIECPDTAKYGESIPVNITISLPEEEEVSGEMYIYDMDDYDEDMGEYYTVGSTSFYSHDAQTQFKLHKMGVNNLKFEIKFDDDKYDTFVFDKKITVNDYVIYLEMWEDEYKYGEDIYMELFVPNILNQDIKVVVNNKKEYTLYYYDYGYDDSLKIRAEDLKYGANNITIIYPGDDVNKAKTFYETLNVGPNFDHPWSSMYNSGDKITLTLPADANGKLLVSIDEENQSPVQMKDGKAVFTIPALDIGSYYINCNYIDDDKYHAGTDFYLNINPKITVPKVISVDGNNIIVEMPSKYNGDILVYRNYWNDDEYLTENITKGKLTNGKAIIPIKFEYETEEYSENDHTLYVNVDWGESSFEGDFTVYVVKDSPDWDLNVTYNFILKNDDQYLIVGDVPSHLNANFSLTIDGVDVEIKDKFSVHYITFDASKLESGKHDFTLKFLGDDYYNPTSYSGSFIVDDMVLDVPKTVDISDYGQLSVVLPGDATGKLVVKVDGKTILNRNVDPEEDASSNYIEIFAEVEDVTAGEHNVEATYTDSKITITKTAKFIGDYDLSVSDEIAFGGDNLSVNVPSAIDSKVVVTIDGVAKKVNIISEKERYFVFISDTADLSVGEHTAVLKYSGDKNYPAKTVEQKFNVTPIVDFYSTTIVKGDGLTLIMPDDAKGNFIVTIRKSTEEEYKEFYNKNAAGKTFVTFDNLTYGHYFVKLNYTGDDYKVKYSYDDEDSFTIAINPELKYPSKVIIGETATVSININEENSRLRIYDYGDGDFDKSEDIVNGVATITLPALKEGINKFIVDIDLGINEEDGTESEFFYEYISIEAVNPITAKDTAVVYSNNGKYSVQMKNADGKAMASGKVTFYIMDGKKQILKKTVNIKNGVATLSYKITQGVKKYTIKTVYNKVSVSKKLTVKHLLTLKKATVKKSAKSLVLTATLAKVNGKYLNGKTIAFKFNGKTYKAKTNKKGVAKATIKKTVLSKLKVGKKVTYQATYLKDTVKYQIKVKK